MLFCQHDYCIRTIINTKNNHSFIKDLIEGPSNFKGHFINLSVLSREKVKAM